MKELLTRARPRTPGETARQSPRLMALGTAQEILEVVAQKKPCYAFNVTTGSRTTNALLNMSRPTSGGRTPARSPSKRNRGGTAARRGTARTPHGSHASSTPRAPAEMVRNALFSTRRPTPSVPFRDSELHCRQSAGAPARGERVLTSKRHAFLLLPHWQSLAGEPTLGCGVDQGHLCSISPEVPQQHLTQLFFGELRAMLRRGRMAPRDQFLH